MTKWIDFNANRQFSTVSTITGADVLVSTVSSTSMNNNMFWNFINFLMLLWQFVLCRSYYEYVKGAWMLKWR